MGKTSIRCALLMATLACLAACSSSGGTHASTPATIASSQGSSAAGLAEARAAVTTYLKAPTSLGLTETLKAKPTGKRIYEIEFPGPVGQVVGDAVVAACKELGCVVTRVPMGSDPASQTAAWQRAVRDKPDAVVSAGVAKAVVGTQMHQLRAEGVKVVVFVSDAVPGVDVDVNLAGDARLTADGKLQADWITADSAGKADVIAYDFPDLAYIGSWAGGVRSELTKTCPSCKFDVQHYGFAIASNFPSRVVSYLQAHPKVNYIALSYGDEMFGLQQALSSAGLANRVKIVGRAGTSLNFQLIKDGSSQKADIGFPVQLFSWGLVDTAARLLAGQDANAPYAQITQILAPSSISFDPKNTPSWYGVADFTAEFAKSWGAAE
jgi:ribose transport system substrate-binding protein